MNFNHVTDDITNAGGTVKINGATPQVQAMGAYTPTATPGNNCASVGITQMIYSRSGSVVTFSAYAEFTATAAGQVSFYLTLPVASNLALYSDAFGTGTFYLPGYTSPTPADVAAVTSTDVIRIYTTASGTSAYYGSIVGQYIIK